MEIDSLEVRIQAGADSAVKSLDDLARRLGVISKEISAIGKNSGLEDFAKKAQEAMKGFGDIQNVAKGISATVEPQMKKVSKTLEQMTAQFANLGKGFTFRGSTADIQKQIDKYTNSLEAAKLKKDELEAAGKTEGKMYEAAVAKTIEYTNVIESLQNQLAEIQTGKIDIDTKGIENTENLIERMKEQIRQGMKGLSVENPIDITSLSKEDFSVFMRLKSEMERAGAAAEQMGEQVREAVTIPASATNYNANAMIATFGEAAGSIENWQQAVEQFGERVGHVLNKSTQLNINISGLEEAGQNLNNLSGSAQNYIKNAQVAAGIKIQTEDYKNVLKDIERTESALDKLQQKQRDMEASGTDTESKEWQRVAAQITAAQSRLDSYISRRNEMQASGTDVEFTGGMANQSIIKNMGVVAGEAISSLRQKISEIPSAIAQAVGNIPVIGRVAKEAAFLGKAAFNGFKSALSGVATAAKKAISAVSKITSAVSKFASGIKGAISKLSKMIKSFLGLKSASKGTNTSLAGGFKTLLKYGLGIETVFALLNKMRTAAKESFSNLAQYSGETNRSLSMFNSSLGALKNSLAVAFAPIVNVVAPILSSFIDMLTKAFNTVGQFFAALTGKTFTAQAVKGFSDYAAGISEAGGAAKKAGKDVQKGIRAFDELNAITINQQEGSGGGGGAGSAGDMFETIEIPDSISNFADKIKNVWSEIWGVFEQAWKDKGEPVVKSAKAALESVKDVALSIGSTFQEVFTNGSGLDWLESGLGTLRSMFGVINSIATAFAGAWNGGAGMENVTSLFNMFTDINNLLTAIGDSFSRVFSNGVGVDIWTNILGIITGVNNTIGNLASNLTEAWNTAGLGDSIWQGILDIVNTILETIHNIADDTAEWMSQLDFTPLLESVDTLLIALEPLTENIGLGLEWFWNNVLLPIAGWTIEEAVPAFLDLLSAAITTLNEVIEALKPLGQWLWENFLQPLGEWTGGLIIDAMETVTGLLNDFSSWIDEHKGGIDGLTETLDGVASGFGDIASIISDNLGQAIQFITDTVLPDLQVGWENFIDLITPFADFLGETFSSAWNDILNPALKTLSEEILPAVIETFQNLWENILVPFGDLLVTVLEPAIKKVTSVLRKLWKNVGVPLAEFIKTTFVGSFKIIVSYFNNYVIPRVNKAISVFKFLWKKVFIPVGDFISDTLGPVFETTFESIGDIIGGIQETFEGLIDFITGTFEGDWEKAWDGVKGIFEGIWDTLSTVVKTPINQVIALFEGLANKVVDGFNWVKKQINTLSLTIPDWVPGAGGKSIGFNLKESAHISIPRLEAGGYIPRQYSIAMVGENGIPEIMGTVGGKPAVAGGVEITGIKDAIHSAEQTEASLLRTAIGLLQVIAKKECGITKTNVGKLSRDYAWEYYQRTGNQAYTF